MRLDEVPWRRGDLGSPTFLRYAALPNGTIWERRDSTFDVYCISDVEFYRGVGPLEAQALLFRLTDEQQEGNNPLWKRSS